MDFYIQKDKDGNAHIVSAETNIPITIDMTLSDAAAFLRRMIEIKAKAFVPSEPRLFYNRPQE